MENLKMSELIFELREVYYSYLGRYPALCDVNMDINKGQKIAIVGANGSGKSTLLRMLDGLIFPDKGSIAAFGRRLNENLFEDRKFASFFRKKVGFVFQNPDIQLFCPSVKEDILFGPLQLGLSKEKIKERLDELLRIFEIEDLMQRPPHQLSVGEKRKVTLASTLAIDPDILILDEPTAGLDPQTTRHIVDLIIEANQSGKTIITATQDLHIVAEIADIIYIFNRDKKIAKFGPSTEVLEDIEFLKQNNLVHIHSHKHKDKAHIHPHQHLDHHI
jgi:cobalt/nickel transport system ATP-binding protein